jgi:hypothetical protein
MQRNEVMPDNQKVYYAERKELIFNKEELDNAERN